jgi:hypothetical protein
MKLFIFFSKCEKKQRVPVAKKFKNYRLLKSLKTYFSLNLDFILSLF